LTVRFNVKPEGRRLCAALMFLTASPSAALANDIEIFGQLTIRAVDELEPIKTSIDDWGSQFTGGERQWIRARAELGFRVDQWELSVFNRALADLRMNEEAVAFYGKIARGESFESGQQIPVNVRAESFTAEGLRLGYRFATDTLVVRTGLSVFRSDYLYSGSLDGTFSTTEGDTFDLRAEVDYVYHRDILLRRPNVEPATGTGFSLDVHADWQAMPGLRIELGAEDLAARIRWRNAPFTRATANTERRSTGDAGFSGLKPTIEGVEGYRPHYTQRLSPKFDGALELGDGAFRPRIELVHQFDDTYAGIGGVLASTSAHQFGLMLYPKYNSVGFRLHSGQFSAELSADDVDERKIGAVSLSLSFGY